MNLTKEQLLKIKNAASVEELAVILKELGKDVPAEDVEKTFNAIQKKGELSDEELDNVAGGGCEISNGLTGVDHPDMVCPDCHQKGMNEELDWDLRWSFTCVNGKWRGRGCYGRYRYNENGVLVRYEGI